MRKMSIASLVIAACAGEAPVRQLPDAGPDVIPPAETARVLGSTRDHFVPVTPIIGATVTTDGIEPPVQATSSDDGDYLLDRVPVGSELSLIVSHPGYRPTRNLAARVAEPEVTRDVSLVSIADARRQYVSLGRTPSPGAAIVIASLVDAAGMPLAGIPLTDVALVDAGGAPAPGVLGPFAFGAAGDIAPAATMSVVSGGHARIAYLDVPARALTLRVQLATEAVAAAADGAVVMTVRVAAPAPVNPDPRFAADIHPRLQTAANGGLGCANCHTLGGSGAVLELDGLPELVLARLVERPGILDTANPAASALLVRPTYEPAPAAQDHPNATFLGPQDADYQLIRRWIANGAKP